MPSVKTRHPLETTLAAILSHPMRVRCFVALAERVTSPTQLAKDFGLLNEEGMPNVSYVAYHVTKLKNLGVVELVETKPRRGATEHFYRAIERPLVDGADWDNLTDGQRESFSRYVLQLHVAEVARAIDAGTFDRRLDRTMYRFPMLVDEQGFGELIALEREGYERRLEIQARSAERMAGDSGLEKVPTMCMAMTYEVPAV